ncbi:MAG TPA: hypothetical protein PLG34_07440 [Spirochaetota bacterium]|nr:hypothetical protein [Spirochaetota bacterium]
MSVTATFAGGTDWKWYIDGAEASTASTLNWNSGGAGIGMHFLSVTTVKDGVGYSGSIPFIVTQ